MSTALHTRYRNERGEVALSYLLVSVFILIPVGLLALSIPIYLEYRTLGETAAQQAVRAYTTASSDTEGRARSEAAVEQVANTTTLSPEDMTVTISGPTEPDAVVTATVTYEIPAINIFGIGSLGTLTVEHSYTEHLGTFRETP